MNELVNIEGTDLRIREWNGQRVVTFKDIDTVHQRLNGTARKAFNRNKNRFQLDSDYFVLLRDEAYKAFNCSAPNGLVLITERGYLKIVKPFNDDLSWNVQDRLIDAYFNVKDFQQVTCEEVEKESDDSDLIEEKPQVPLIKGWHNRNKGRLARIQRRTGFTLTKIYHCILKNVGEKYNLKEANNMYKKCTGKEPEYAMDIIEYFPELAEAADRYLDGVERALSARR